MNEPSVPMSSTNHLLGEGLLGVVDPALVRADLDRDRHPIRGFHPREEDERLEAALEGSAHEPRLFPRRA